MLEVKGNLWSFTRQQGFFKCITTNGTIKSNGECVMGAGVALQAKQKWPEFPKILGDHLSVFGNHVWHHFDENYSVNGRSLITFPVKHNWWEKADLELIKRSADELSMLHVTTLEEWKIVLPRPGCGNGGLEWDDVKPVLEKYLDDDILVIDL